MYFLDSDIFTAFLKGQPRIVSEIRSHPIEEIAVSVLTAEELLSGQLAEIRRARTSPPKLHRDYAFLITLLAALNQFAIELYPEGAEAVFAAFNPKSKRVGSVDCKLIAHAIVANAIIVTNNLADFEAIRAAENLDDLVIENWM